MDSMITAAARALAAGDPLGVLKRIALRDDAPALALRGIAMAQLGDLVRAKLLLKSASRAFGVREAVARARCVVAEAEIALVCRDLAWPVEALDRARETLETHGDHLNAVHARNIEMRRLLLVGRLDEVERLLTDFPSMPLPPALNIHRELIVAGLAIRRLRTTAARAALARAGQAAREANIPALMAEVENAAQALEAPAARTAGTQGGRTLFLEQVEALFSSDKLIIDACRYVVRAGNIVVPLASRPVLFALARTLGEALPGDVSRDSLLQRAFGAKQADESHRARLRVEIGRLRAELRGLADIKATKRGFALVPGRSRDIVVLAPPVDGSHAGMLAFLADGEAWSSTALAIALGVGARTVQRALEQLATEGKVQSFGLGRARRWMTPSVPGFPTVLLLPGPLPGS
jgi:hypothetical protein